MVNRLWAAEKRGPEAVAAVQRELQGVLDQAADAHAEVTEAAAALATRNREIADSLSGIVDAGHAAFDPAQLDPYLAQMEELGLLTAAQAAALRQLADDAHVDWRAMEKSAKQYGVAMKTVVDENGQEVQVFDESLLGLGHAQAKLTDEAGQLASAWTLLTGEGTNTQVAIEGMTDEAQGFVTKALEMGIALPEAMRPMLDAMVSQGRLTDENGEKLTDLSGLTFAAPIAEGFDLLADKIQLLIITLGGPSGLSKAVEDMVDSAGLDIKDLAGEWAGMTTDAKAAFESFAAFVEDRALREITATAGLNYDANRDRVGQDDRRAEGGVRRLQGVRRRTGAQEDGDRCRRRLRGDAHGLGKYDRGPEGEGDQLQGLRQRRARQDREQRGHDHLFTAIARASMAVSTVAVRLPTRSTARRSDSSGAAPRRCCTGWSAS